MFVNILSYSPYPHSFHVPYGVLFQLSFILAYMSVVDYTSSTGRVPPHRARHITKLLLINLTCTLLSK